jgi:aminomethyltransferase
VSDESGVLRRTALYDAHLALGGRIVPFGGFEMPVQYPAGILAEHDAVRNRAGLFDLSHMGQFALRGPNVGTWAETLTINNVDNIKPGVARYNIFTNVNGGAHDDVIFYRLDADRWLLVVNAGNADKMWPHVSAEAAKADGVEIEDLRGKRALIAVQGPKSVEILAPYIDGDIAAMKYYTCIETTVRGSSDTVIVARTGYTGEDGFEIFLAADDATPLWDLLLAENADKGLAPCGLGARDVLRLEAGMPLYGNELTEEITPVQAGLNWAIKFEKPSFRGRDALIAQRDAATAPRIVGLTMDGRLPARSGYPVFANGAQVGEIRSGSWAPTVGKSIATALIDPSAAEPGTAIEVEIRGTRHPATVVALPFYKRPKAASTGSA